MKEEIQEDFSERTQQHRFQLLNHWRDFRYWRRIDLLSIAYETDIFTDVNVAQIIILNIELRIFIDK